MRSDPTDGLDSGPAASDDPEIEASKTDHAAGGTKSGLSHFLSELRRRKLGPFLVAYVAISWVLLQLAEIVAPAFFEAPETVVRFLVVGIVLLFPPSAALAWLFELTRDGITRTASQGFDSLWPRVGLFAATTIVALGGVLVIWSPSGPEPTSRAPAMAVGCEPDVPITSIAVLPLRDNSEDSSLAYMGAGLHDELILRLSQLDGVRVASRTSVGRYAEETISAPTIASELQVDALVDGSVNRSLTRFRVVLNLVNAPCDSQISSFAIDTTATDLLSLQTYVADEVALRVAEATGGSRIAEEEAPAQLAEGGTRGGRRSDPAAVDAYLRGTSQFALGTTEGLQQAHDHFQEAVSIDSLFPLAYAGRAAARLGLLLAENEISVEEAMTSWEDALRARELNPSSLQVREVFSQVSQVVDLLGLPIAVNLPGNRPELPTTSLSRPVFPEAELPNPFPGTSVFDSVWAEGVSLLGRGLSDLFANSELIREPNRDGYDLPAGNLRLVLRGDAPEARSTVRRLVMLRTTGDFRLLADSLRSLMANGVIMEEIGWELIAQIEATAGNPNGLADALQDWSRSGVEQAPSEEEADSLATSLRREGTEAYWRWWLDELNARAESGRRVPLTELATAHVGAGRHEEALALLARAAEIGEPHLLRILTDPTWDKLRRHGEFVAAARKARELNRPSYRERGMEGTRQEGRPPGERDPRNR